MRIEAFVSKTEQMEDKNYKIPNKRVILIGINKNIILERRWILLISHLI
jgi:hypothetical protein